MEESNLSPDGKFIWNGSEWIPAPPNSEISANQTSNAEINTIDDNQRTVPPSNLETADNDISMDSVRNLLLHKFPKMEAEWYGGQNLHLKSSISSRIRYSLTEYNGGIFFNRDIKVRDHGFDIFWPVLYIFITFWTWPFTIPYLLLDRLVWTPKKAATVDHALIEFGLKRN